MEGAHPAVKSLMMQYNDELARKMANGLAEMQAIDEETAYKQLTNMNLSPTSAPGGLQYGGSYSRAKGQRRKAQGLVYKRPGRTVEVGQAKF